MPSAHAPDAQSPSMHKLLTRKRLLLVAITATCLLPMLFLRFDEPTALRLVSKVLAKAGSLIGSVLLVWQLVLGFRGVLHRVLPDRMWLIALHQRLGVWGLLWVLLHPAFITVYYLARYDDNLWLLDFSGWKDPYVLLGMILLGLWIFLVLTSTWLRQRLTYGQWFATHMGSYVVLPLLFVHSFAIGMTVRETGLWWVWIALAGVTGAAYLWRIAARLGAFGARYSVVAADEVARDIVRIRLQPAGRAIWPALGQFIYFRKGRWHKARPFTVSGLDDETGELEITVKAVSPASEQLGQIRPGQEARLDGPYGMFLREITADERTPVLIAGGIGITPFLRLAEWLGHVGRRDVTLFYGTRGLADVAYAERLEATGAVRIVHVLSEEEAEGFETGFVDQRVLRKHLSEPLEQYDFYVCGPGVMVDKVTAALRNCGVPEEQIHYESFGY